MVEQQDTRAERLVTALNDFIRTSPDVEATAIVSYDGLPLASALPPDLEEDRLGAMSAALLSLGEQAALGLGRGQLNQVFVEGEHGYVFLMSARDQAVLAAVARRTAKIGLMLFEMRRVADEVGEVLQAPRSAARPAPPAPPAGYDEPAAGEPPRPETLGSRLSHAIGDELRVENGATEPGAPPADEVGEHAPHHVDLVDHHHNHTPDHHIWTS